MEDGSIDLSVQKLQGSGELRFSAPSARMEGRYRVEAITSLDRAVYSEEIRTSVLSKSS